MYFRKYKRRIFLDTHIDMLLSLLYFSMFFLHKLEMKEQLWEIEEDTFFDIHLV